jgi:hypothetical protein
MNYQWQLGTYDQKVTPALSRSKRNACSPAQTATALPVTCIMDARVLRQQSCRRQRLHEPWFMLLFAPNGPKVRPQLAPRNLGSASDVNEASCIVHRWELIRRKKTQESPGSGRVYISHIALQKISQDTDDCDSG